MMPIASARELTGKEIINRVNELMNRDTVWAKVKMTILTTSGKKRTFIYESFSKDKGEKNLIRYLEPKKLRGQAILMLNNADDIWVYFPRTRRVRKLATHAKKRRMEGSDFSYEDMGSGETFIKEFIPKRLGDEKVEKRDCFKIELTRKEGGDVSYSRIIMWVDKERFIPIVVDYYDGKNPNLHLKRLILSDIKVIDGVPTAMKMIMHNKLDNTRTVVEFLDVKYDVKLDDSLFTERGLRR
jgi:outer membrane lipoprotein-sorting protein